MWRLFWIDYLIHMQSVEGAFVSIVRYTREHWPHLGWWPLWYCGMPFANTYQPLLHTVAAAVSGAVGRERRAGVSHRVRAGVRAGTGGVVCACDAADGTPRSGLRRQVSSYSLCSPSALLMPAIARDLGTLFGARRLHAAVVYGDSPNVAALTLLPLALLAIDRALRPGVLRLLLAVAGRDGNRADQHPGHHCLRNGSGGICVRLLRDRRTGCGWRASALCGGLLSLCIVPPSTLMTLFSNTRWMEPADQWNGAHVWQAGILGIAGAVALALAWRSTFSSLVVPADLRERSAGERLGGHHADRAADAISPGDGNGLGVRRRVRGRRGGAVQNRGCGIALVLVYGTTGSLRDVFWCRRHARKKRVQSGIEWLDRNAHGARVMTPGSDGDLAECVYRHSANHRAAAIRARLSSIGPMGGDRADISIAWLQALGAKYVAVVGTQEHRSLQGFRASLEIRRPAEAGYGAKATMRSTKFRNELRLSCTW